MYMYIETYVYNLIRLYHGITFVMCTLCLLSIVNTLSTLNSGEEIHTSLQNSC